MFNAIMNALRGRPQATQLVEYITEHGETVYVEEAVTEEYVYVPSNMLPLSEMEGSFPGSMTAIPTNFS